MWAFIAVRSLILISNFLVPYSFNFLEVISIRQILFLGEPVSVLGKAAVNPWQWVGLASVLLFMLFVVDAAVSLWRKGAEDQKRKAIVIAVTIAISFLLVIVQGHLVVWRVIQLPLILSPPFLVMVGGMAYELGLEILRANRLAADLHESEERLGLAARSARLGMWMWNPSENRFWATDQARALFGFQNNESIAFDQWLTPVHSEDLEFVRRKIKGSLATGNDFEAAYKVSVAGGKMQWIAAHGRPETDGSGNRIIRGVVRDVTDQKQTQLELERTLTKLQEAQRIAHLGYWDRDLDTDLLTWSDETYRIYGLAPQDRTVTHATWQELIHPEDRRMVIEAVAEALRGGPQYDVEYRVIRPSGAVRFVHSEGDVTRDEVRPAPPHVRH